MTDRDGADGRRAQDGAEQMETEGGAECSGNQGGGDPEDHGRAGGKVEPDREME